MGATPEVRRARMFGIVLGLFTILSIIFLVYALEQKVRADVLEEEVNLLRHELELTKSSIDSLRAR